MQDLVPCPISLIVRSILLFAVPALLSAQIKDDPAERIRTAMRSSLDLQRESIRRQTSTAREAPSNEFFTVPWPGAEELPATGSCDPLSETALTPLVEDAARREDLKPALLREVIQHESGMRPCAVSPKGAQGLMQLMPATSDQLGVRNPFDPKSNVDAGAKYLRQLLTRYAGDLALALAAYNAGPARVDKAGEVPQIEETQQYVNTILDRVHSLQ